MRLTIWNVGWSVLAAAWLGPLPALAQTSFAAHMTLHMVVVAIAAPLLSIAIAGTKLDPVLKFPWWFMAIPASIGELLIVWAWHAPVLHHWARHDAGGFVIEQAMFLASGLWMWLAAFGGPFPRSRSRCAAGVIGLLLTSTHMTLLGALLSLSPRLLYAHHHGSSLLPPLLDQQVGGTVMLVVGGLAYLLGGLRLTQYLLTQTSITADASPLNWNTSLQAIQNEGSL